MRLLVQIGTKRSEPLMEIPCMMELVKADTLNGDSKTVACNTIDFLTDAKFCMAPPGTPQDRVAFLPVPLKKHLTVRP